MKTWLLSFGILAAAATVSAKDMTGRFAVGGNKTLHGIEGVNLVAQLNKLVLLDATFGMRHEDDNAPATSDWTKWGFGSHLYLNFADFDNSNLYLGAGINLSGDTDDNKEGVNFAIELPMRPTWYFNDHLAIFTQTGMVFDIAQQKAKSSNADSKFRFELKTDLLAGAGVNFFF